MTTYEPKRDRDGKFAPGSAAPAAPTPAPAVPSAPPAAGSPRPADLTEAYERFHEATRKIEESLSPTPGPTTVRIFDDGTGRFCAHFVRDGIILERKALTEVEVDGLSEIIDFAPEGEYELDAAELLTQVRENLAFDTSDQTNLELILAQTLDQ